MSDLSISALRAFRAVARCGSFSAAARELGCAQSGISRHIVALEAHTKQTLVLRGHREVQLTAAGKLYLETATRVLDELDQGSMRVARAAGSRPTVKILAMPAFTSCWLMPRLARLGLMNFDAEIEVSTSIWDADFRKDRHDLAIHYGDGSWAGAQLLMQDSLVPVIAPKLLMTQTLERVEDLARFPWLHDSLRASKWPHWLASCDAGELQGPWNMRCQTVELSLSAAAAGVGIAMGHAVLIERQLGEGTLVEAWPHHAPLAAGYHLVQPRRSQGNPAARFLADWLLKEAAVFRKSGARM